jgi:hypothetical protein
MDEAVRTKLCDQIRSVTFPITAEARDDLRALVFEYVDALKGRGWLPEQVVVAVKQACHDSGLRPSSHFALTETPPDDTAQLLIDTVAWCIERYYPTPSSGGEVQPNAGSP